MPPLLDHPYRGLHVPAIASAPGSMSGRELHVAYGVLAAFSAIQIASGAQLVVGALGLAGALTGFLSTRRPRWKTSSSSS
jgi:hypothetical protein